MPSSIHILREAKRFSLKAKHWSSPIPQALYMCTVQGGAKAKPYWVGRSGAKSSACESTERLTSFGETVQICLGFKGEEKPTVVGVVAPRHVCGREASYSRAFCSDGISTRCSQALVAEWLSKLACSFLYTLESGDWKEETLISSCWSAKMSNVLVLSKKKILPQREWF